MTFSIGHVSGGTNAGRKRQLPAPKPWMCVCAPLPGGPRLNGFRVHRAYMSRCSDCGMERP